MAIRSVTFLDGHSAAEKTTKNTRFDQSGIGGRSPLVVELVMSHQSLPVASEISPGIETRVVVESQEFRKNFFAERISKGASLSVGPKPVSFEPVTESFVYQ